MPGVTLGLGRRPVARRHSKTLDWLVNTEYTHDIWVEPLERFTPRVRVCIRKQTATDTRTPGSHSLITVESPAVVAVYQRVRHMTSAGLVL